MSDNDSAIIEITVRDARNAKIAARKEGMDSSNPAIEELDRAFEEKNKSDIDEEMRFVSPAEDMCEVAMKVQKHGKNRREKGHNSSKDKYYSVGDRIESQLVRQGAWTEGEK
jgi:hypothetical protein